MKQTRIKLYALMLFLLAAGVTFIRGGHAQQPQGPQGDRPVEQTRKNIQVLKGMPDSQLIPAMNFISTALGVRCDHCHVVPQFEKDDKPAKAIARRMMQMQFDINKGNKELFATTGAVTCYTCHHGQTKPQVMPGLPQAQLAAGPAAGPAKAAEALPTVDQVLEKYAQAVGGRAAYEKLKSRVLKGTQVGSDGTASPLETYRVAPNKIASTLTTKNGTLETGYNGTAGWTKGPRGLRELTDGPLAQLKRTADFYGDLHLKELYPGLAVVDREKVGDREAYVLASQVSDTRLEKFYFDTQTGLLLRIISINQTLIAPVPEQTDFEDYREVDGIKMAFTVRQSYVDPRNDWTRKYTEVKHNVAIDEAKFNMPPASATPAPTPTPR